jgi:ABC-type sugar transport system permease subunit
MLVVIPIFFALGLLPFVLRRKWPMALPVAFILSIATVAPVAWALYVSFTEYGVFQTAPVFAGLKNYEVVIRDSGFKLSLRLTALWSTLKTTLEIAISFFIALRLRKATRRSKAALLLLGVGWFIPSFITVSGWRAFVQGYGGYSLLNTLLGTSIDVTLNPLHAFSSSLLVSVWLSIPLSTMVILGMLGKVSKELDDVMKIDGAGDLATSSILFGQIRYLLIPYSLFQLARSMKEFTSVFLMTGNGPLLAEGFTPHTLTGSTTFLGIVLFRKFSTARDYGLLSAYAVFVGVFALIWILGALFSRGEVPRRHRQVLYLSSAAHVVLGLFAGWNWLVLPVVVGYSILPLIIPRFRKPFRRLVGVLLIYEVVVFVLSIVQEGISGVIPATLLSVPMILLSIRYRLPHFDFTVPGWLKRALLIICLVPTAVVVLYICYLSFASDSEILPFQSELTLANYGRVISDGLLGNIFNTLKIAFWAFAVVLLAGVPFSYLFSLKRNLFVKAIASLILFGSLYTGMHTLLPMYFVFDRLGLVNNLFGVGMVVCIQAMPLTILLLGGFFSTVPRELREVSLLEGLSETGYLLRVLIPLSLPIIGGLLTYILVSSFNSFSMPLILLNSQELMPFSLKIYSYVGEVRSFYTSWNLFGAASTIGIIPLLLFFRSSLKLIYSSNLRDQGIEYD